MMPDNKNTIIKADIAQQIINGLLAPGQPIEAETHLAQLYGVSRMTIRKALDELVFEGFLIRIYKKGTFVSNRSKFEGFLFGLGYSDEIQKRGMTPGSRDVTVALEYADNYSTENLNLSPGQKVWKIKRVRLADKIPVAYEEAYFTYPLIPELTVEVARHSIYGYLEQNYGLRFSYADQKLDAVAATPELACFLSVSPGTPLIRTDSVAYLQNGTPFNSGLCYYRTDNFKLLQCVKK